MNKVFYSLYILMMMSFQISHAQYNRQYSDSLFEVGVKLYNNVKYEDAYHLFVKCDQYDREHLDSTDNRLGYCKMWEGCCCYNLGRIDDAKKLNPKYYMCQPIDRKLTWKSDSLSNLIDKLESIKIDSFYENHTKAIKLLEECISEEIHNLGDSCYWVANTLEHCGWNYENNGSFEEAFKCHKKAFDIRTNNLPEDHVDCGKSFLNMAQCYYNLNENKELAIDYYLKGFRILDINHFPHNNFYAERMYSLAWVYEANNEIQLAIDYMHQSLAIFKELYGMYNISVGRGYHALALLYLNAKKMGYAERNALKAISIRKEVLGENHIYYNNSLSILSTIYAEAGKYNKALEVDSIAIVNYKSLEKLNDYYSNQQQDLYFNLISKYANHLEKNRQYNEAISQLTAMIRKAADSQIVSIQELLEYKTDLARCYSKIGNLKKAIEIEKNCLNMLLEYPEYNPLSKHENNPFVLLCNYYARASLFDETKKLCLETNVFKSLGLDETNLNDVYTLYEAIADMLSENGLYEGSISFYHEIIKNKIASRNKDVITQAYMDLAYNYSCIDSLNQCVLYSKKAKQSLDSYGNHNKALYADNIYRLASYYRMNNQNDSAIYYYEQAYKLMKKNGDPHHADMLSLLSVCYLEVNPQKAEECMQKAIQEKLEGRLDSVTYYLPLSRDYLLLCDFYYHNNDYTSQIAVAKEFMSVFNNSDVNYSAILYSLVKALSKVTDYNQAIAYGEQLLKYDKEYQKDNIFSYWQHLFTLSEIYRHSGNEAKGVQYGMQAIQQIKSEVNQYSNDYVEALYGMGSLYSDIGEYDKAIECQNQILEITSEIHGENSLEMGLAFHNLAFYYGQKSDNMKAVEFYEKAIKIKKELLKEDDPLYLVSLKNMGTALSEAGEYDKALELFKEILSLEKIIYGTSSPQVAITLAETGEVYGKVRDYNHELESKEAAYKILMERKTLAPFDPSFVKRGMIRAYYKSKMYSESSAILCKELHDGYKEIIKEIIHLPEYLRSRLWYREQSLFIQDLPRLAYTTRADSLISLMYDYSALFGKGLILNTNREISQIALLSDSITHERFDELEKTKALRESELKIDPNKRLNEIEDLDEKIQKLESELITSQEDFDRLKEKTHFSWKDIQKQLDDDAIAIEFFSVQYPDEYSDSVVYMALTLKKDYLNPKLFHLFYLNELPKWEMGNESDLYKMIWEPLESELIGANKIYFSTWYSLNTIPIENLPTRNGTYMSEIYDMYRLSSTRELIERHPNHSISNVAVWGGIDYEGTSHDSTNSLNANPQLPSLYRGVLDTGNGRGGVDYLPFTLVEAKNITKEAKKRHINYTLYSGLSGSEESFKNLSNSKVDVVHIATHGVYLNDNETKSYTNILTQQIKDNPLNRSFLVMAGGNRLSRRDSIPEGSEDGIMTAEEISMLNLRNIDMVVLSTCQSGLGMSSPEGVVGLQQGFKRAGVNTILMTLGNVDDEATGILMSEFYKKLLKGENKQQALKYARKHLRRIKNGKYDKPEYWASFIMLDGLN